VFDTAATAPVVPHLESRVRRKHRLRRGCWPVLAIVDARSLPGSRRSSVDVDIARYLACFGAYLPFDRKRRGVFGRAIDARSWPVRVYSRQQHTKQGTMRRLKRLLRPVTNRFSVCFARIRYSARVESRPSVPTAKVTRTVLFALRIGGDENRWWRPCRTVTPFRTPPPPASSGSVGGPRNVMENRQKYRSITPRASSPRRPTPTPGAISRVPANGSPHRRPTRSAWGSSSPTTTLSSALIWTIVGF